LGFSKKIAKQEGCISIFTTDEDANFLHGDFYSDNTG